MFKLIVLLTVIDIALGAYLKRNITVHEPSLGIVGGTDTDISLHPFQVSVQSQGYHFCGGFLISSNWIVTAAHCLSGGDNDDLSIRAGSSITSAGGQTSPITSYIIHPGYNHSIIDNDIALLYVSEPINTTNASPAALPSYDQVIPDGAIATITGWGTTEEGGIEPSVLQQAQVPIVNLTTCRSAYAPFHQITDNMFCAGEYETGGKDSCQGDSGGPAEIEGEVVGVISWGNGCARPMYPGVYTKVANYRNWIKQNTGI